MNATGGPWFSRRSARADTDPASGLDTGSEIESGLAHDSQTEAGHAHGARDLGDTAAEPRPVSESGAGPVPGPALPPTPDTTDLGVTDGSHTDEVPVPGGGRDGLADAIPAPSPEVFLDEVPDVASHVVSRGDAPGPAHGGRTEVVPPRHLDARAAPPVAPWATASITVNSMTGGTVTGAMWVTHGLLPLEQVPVRQAHLRWVLDTHARPAGFDSLVRLVRDQTRIVVFDIEENAGRTTHAEALAACLAGLAAVPDRPTLSRPSGTQTADSPGPLSTDPDLSGHDSTGPAGRGADIPPYPHAQYPAAQHAGETEASGGSVGEARGTVFDVARLMFGGSPHFPDTRLPTDRGRVWLLEIPTDEEGFRVAETFGDCLPVLDRLLAEQDGRLVVLTRPEQWRRIGGSPSERWPSARDLLTGVGPAAVARAQLTGRMSGIDTEGWLGHPDIAAMVEQSGTTGAVELAEAILAAERTSANLLPADPASTGTPGAVQDAQALHARRIAMVVDSRGQWRRQLLGWHRHPDRTAFERDFQVAAAALTGLPVTDVYYGATLLNTQFGGRGAVESAGQDAPGVIAMLDAVGGDLTAEDCIRFPRPGWADSILEYFWLDRPLARGTFLDWLAKAPGYRAGDALEAASDDQRRAAARRITRFALGWAARHNREAPLAKLALAWRESHRGLRQELVEVLSAVACAHSADPAEVGSDIAPLVVHQRYVHRLLLDWAKSSTVELAHVVLQVCAGPFSDRYTGKALVRLKHAGRHADDKTRLVLEQVIARLWQESSARATLIAEIAGWCDTAQHYTAGSIAFACLAAITDTTPPDLRHPIRDDDDTATADPTADGTSGRGVALLRQTGDYTPDHPVLGRCWRAHLGTAPAADSAALVTLWLEAAASDPTQRHAVLDVLRLAVRGTTAEDRTTRDVVRGIARTWSTGSPDRKALYHNLTDVLDTDIIGTLHTRLSDGAGS